jgi:four helix bundle protein
MGDHRTLDALKEAHAVALGVTLASRDHWKPWASAMFSQANRAALSVQLNITEGWTFSRSPTATRHLAIAYGSAKETADILQLMAETGALPVDLLQNLQERSNRCIRLIVGLLKTRRPLQ